MQQPHHPKSHFKVFVDEHSPDESQSVEEQWQRTRKQQRSKKLCRVLIIGAIAIGLIFALMLNLFLTHKSETTILDNSDPDYTYIQTTFPHLKVLVSKHSDSYQAKVMRAIGIYQPELVSWIQGNVAPGMRILFIPDQNSGVNLLGVALSYYLYPSTKGRLEMLITTPEYKQLAEKNLKLMQSDSQAHPLLILNDSTHISGPYDLVVIENSNFHQQYSQLSTFPRLVLIRKEKDSSGILEDTFGSYNKYQITSGVINEQISQISQLSQNNQNGKWYGYALKPVQISVKETYKCFLLQKNRDSTLNLCPQNEPEFQSKEYLRSLVQFIRSKSVETLYYALDNNRTLEILKAIKTNTKVVQSLGPSQLNSISQSEVNYFVLNFKAAKQLSTKPTGHLIVQISSQVEATEMINKFSSSSVRFLPPFNNHGCFYPPHPMPNSPNSFPQPYFLMLEDERPQDEN